MKKIVIMLFSLVLVIGSFSYIHDETHYYVNAKGITRGGDEFGMDMDLSNASEASFIGEEPGDYSGSSVSSAGDVNGDGYDDIIIGAWGNQEGGGLGAGQTYLILGKASGWAMDTDLANADASFIGESSKDRSGHSVSGAGDVNGDGYDDIIIGAWGNQDGGGINAGKAYLIFGKSSDWAMHTDLSSSDASFIGEDEYNNLGYSVSGAGDVNSDGYDDFLLGARGNSDGGGLGAGQTYLILGKSSGWTMDTDLSNADASFIGEDAGDESGFSVSGAGDVNGDGYDDILIGADRDSEGGERTGQTYLILGKGSGWIMDRNLSNSTASFIGEGVGDLSGNSVSGGGDVNGDGFDDILIGARSYQGGDNLAGQAYLILGKGSGWTMDIDLANATASFIGENERDWAGISVSDVGDINLDGYDDLIIGACRNDEGGDDAGQAYLLYGKSSGWIMDMNLSNSTASFIGEYSNDFSGLSVSGAGDVNGDGIDDILIGADRNNDGGEYAGKTYLILGEGDTEPLEVYSVKTYSDEDYTLEIDRAEIDDEIYIEMRGLDGNNSNQNRARVSIKREGSDRFGFPILLEETGMDTGIYQNSFKFSTKFDPSNRLLNVSIGDIVNISSRKDPLRYALIKVVAPVALKPLEDETFAIEDEEYRVHYWNFGYNDVSKWTYDSDSEWLRFDTESHEIYGIPDNSHVGSCWVRLNLTDGSGHFDEHYFSIEVINTPPCIFNENNITAFEGERYLVDYECDDEGLGHTFWEIYPNNIGWLDFNEETGILNGIPSTDDIGTYDINISVNDGNGGKNWTSFTLTVIDINDPPEILTNPLISIEQAKNYYVQFNAYDRDDINTFEWTLETNAGFLEIDKTSGTVSGTPTNDDIGSYFVNVTAIDLRSLPGWLNYTLVVIDINDPPTWSTIPSDTQIDQGKKYTFTVEVIDVDLGDSVSYSISSQPSSDISIDETTGDITWIGSLEGLIPNPNYVLNVEVSASDGEETITHGFTITVIPNPSPTSTILGPDDGKRITSEGILLEWEGEDDAEEPLKYDIYLGTSQTDVSMWDNNALWMKDVEGNSIHSGKLDAGKTYYWTVIPKDIFSAGICTNDVWSFSVNIPPIIQEFTIPEAKIGVEFRLSMTGSDLNGDDLEFILREGPAGMDIFEGMISWVPSENKVGTHAVNVSLSDGYETIYEEFEVVVSEKEIIDDTAEKGSPIVLIIVMILIILILAGVGVGLFLYMKKKKESEPTEGSNQEKPTENAGPPQEEKQTHQQPFGPP